MNKILITYSSRTNTAVGVAEAIGLTLESKGFHVDVVPMQEVKDLSSYNGIIAGSAIQSQKWLPEAMQFLKIHQKELNSKPFAMFSVCMTLAMPHGEKYRSNIEIWLQPVRQLVKPFSEGLFAGKLDISKIPSFADRLKFRLSVLFGVWKEGDHRNWAAIQSWAESLEFGKE